MNADDKNNNSPDFYIFDPNNKNRLGAAFRHKKGDGFNIVIGKDRYVAFPPRRKKTDGDDGK